MREYDADDEERFAAALGIRVSYGPAIDRKSARREFKAQPTAANDLSFEISAARALTAAPTAWLHTFPAGLLLVAAAVLASVAVRVIAQTEPPTVVAIGPAARPLDADRFKRIIEEQYPQLLKQKVVGTPVLTVLFDAQGRVAGTRLEISSAKRENLTASVFQFAPMGVSSGELKDIGSTGVDLPLNHVLVVFARKD